MTNRNQPKFPIRIVWAETGEVESYEDPLDLLRNLEDFDSDQPNDQMEAEVTDALGRPVHLLVKIWQDTCEVRLESPEAGDPAE